MKIVSILFISSYYFLL